MELPLRAFPSLHLLLDGLQHTDKETRCKELRDLPKRTELIIGRRVAPCLWTSIQVFLHHITVSFAPLSRHPPHPLLKHYFLSPCYSSFCSLVHSTSRDLMPYQAQFLHIRSQILQKLVVTSQCSFFPSSLHSNTKVFIGLSRINVIFSRLLCKQIKPYD